MRACASLAAIALLAADPKIASGLSSGVMIVIGSSMFMS